MEKTWNERYIESIRKERIEIEKKYNIRIGETEIYCASCGRPWGYGNHTCQEIRLKRLGERKKKRSELRRDYQKNQSEIVLNRIQRIGAKKFSILSFERKDDGRESFIAEKVLRQWIYRGNVPERFIDQVNEILRRV